MTWLVSTLCSLARAGHSIAGDGISFLAQWFRSSATIRAEILFLRKQLAMYEERGIKARRPRNAEKFVLSRLASFFDWRASLIVVKPQTLLRWHRLGFKLLWRWRSRPVGRPAIPHVARQLIRLLATDNPSWGEERIANELLLKLGLRLSPRTVARYLPRAPDGSRISSGQRWSTFIRNHARAIVATDFFTVVTASFRTLYVFVVLEVGSRRVLHFNVTSHPTALWTMQQLREAIPCNREYRYLVHDRDSIFSREVDQLITRFGLRVLKTPARAPKANAFVERFGGTMRRECLDFLIPLNERHLRIILTEWVNHYNRGRPHMSLGPGIPDPEHGLPVDRLPDNRLPDHARVITKPILGGLHHEYRLERQAA